MLAMQSEHRDATGAVQARGLQASCVWRWAVLGLFQGILGKGSAEQEANELSLIRALPLAWLLVLLLLVLFALRGRQGGLLLASLGSGSPKATKGLRYQGAFHDSRKDPHGTRKQVFVEEASFVE